jgi:hypothetical protein
MVFSNPDQIHYREYKILLRPEQFTDAGRFKEYWKVICDIAHSCEVKVETNEHAFHRLVREVLFYDTPEFDLYRNAFILRKRTFYKDGWPLADHELTIKYRHPDFHAAAAVDVRPELLGSSAIKFKEEILPLKDRLGGIRSLYSHNCVLTSPKVILDQGMEDVRKVFPALAKIDIEPRTRMALVNNVAVEEVQVEPGHFDFGHGMKAKATVAIWRNRASEASLVGEFAYQAKFDHVEELHRKAKDRSEAFYLAVQTHAPEWALLGTTKTAMVYGIHGKLAANHEG